MSFVTPSNTLWLLPDAQASGTPLPVQTLSSVTLGTPEAGQ